MSKTLNDWVSVRMKTTAVTGRRAGNVTKRKDWIGVAPSTRAASYKSSSTAWRPARKMMTPRPRVDQECANASA